MKKNDKNLPPSPTPQLKFTKVVILLLFIFILLMLLPNIFLPYKIEKLTYSQFLTYIKEGKIKEVSIAGNNIKGRLILTTNTGKTLIIPFISYIPYHDPELIKFLLDNNVEIRGEENPASKWWINLFYSIIVPIVVIFFIFWLLSRHSRGPAKFFSFGQSKARLFTKDDKKFTFDDVAGVDEAKEELKEIIEFLKDPKKFQRLGAKMPKGILLVGPPGTGKTLLAKAVAGEANVRFLSISGSDFVEMFVGVGASRVRDLFEQGKKNAPCIIFIDEIDAVGRQRGAGLGGGHDEREQTLNQLLVEMDGFNTQEGVVLIAATNRPDVLDPALLRPGRFDRHIVVDTPDIKGREEILKVHTQGKPLAADIDIKVLARRTPGFVGSDLANLVNEATLLAARRQKEVVGMEEFEEAIDRVIAGPQRKSRLISEKEKKIVAYHESGHALVAYYLKTPDPVHKISIMPRGHRALGYTLQLPLEDKYLTTKSEIIDKLTTLLGGRVAEEVVFNEVTTGAQNDIERATDMAERMVCAYGMSEELGPLTFGKRHQEVFLGRDIVKERNFSEEVASKIDKEVRKIIQTCYNKAKELIQKHRDKLDRLAKELIEKEILGAEEIKKLLE